MGDWQAQLWLTLDVVIAAILGGLVGVDRERKDKPAGLRTHMLVAAAVCLLVHLGRDLITLYAGREGVDTDPVRILQAIVIGVSFLGTGTIISHEKGQRVEGLTTAASILLTTGVAIAVGMQQYVAAGLVTLLDLVVLAWIARIERRLGG